MSAEKDIVNYWLNQQGFFTIRDISASGNRNIGILAIKFENEKISKLMHVEVICSVSGSLSDSSESKTIIQISEKRFEDKLIRKTISNYINLEFGERKDYDKVLIVGGLSQSRKSALIKEFSEKNIKVFDFEEIMFDVIKNMDTRYYNDDVVRSMQFMKYLFLSNPERHAKLIIEGGVLNAQTRGRFINELLSHEMIRKEFTKTDEERIVLLLKHSVIKKPGKLAEIIERDVLNRKTRKPFLESLLEIDRMKKLRPKQSEKTEKIEKPLSYFVK